jgi:hypothetical protein
MESHAVLMRIIALLDGAVLQPQAALLHFPISILDATIVIPHQIHLGTHNRVVNPLYKIPRRKENRAERSCHYL